MRRIKKVTVKCLSLCKRGANQLPVLYKAEDGTVEIQTLTKALPDFEERGELLVVGYAPEHRDSQGDIADAAVCKEMAHTFMHEGANLDIRHDGNLISRERAFVAESFIIQKDDPRFVDFKDYSGKPVDVTNGWGALIKIEDKELRKLFKSEGWNGVSLSGPAELEPDDSVRKALDHFRQSQEYEMKPEELAEVLRKNNEALVAALRPAPVAPAAPTIADPSAPSFTGDPLKKEDVEKYARELKSYQLRKSVDWKDTNAVDAYLATLTKGPGDDDDDDVADDADDDAPAPKVKKEQRRSDQPTTDGARRKSKVPEEMQGMNLSKEELEGFEIGKRMADWANTQGVK